MVARRLLRPLFVPTPLFVSAPALADSWTGREFWSAWLSTPDVTTDDPSRDMDAQLVLLAGYGPVTVMVQGPGVGASVAVTAGNPALVQAILRTCFLDPDCGDVTGSVVEAAFSVAVISGSTA